MSTEDKDDEVRRDLAEARACAERMRHERDVWALAAMRAHGREREKGARDSTQTTSTARAADRVWTADEAIGRLQGRIDSIAAARESVARLYTLAAVRSGADPVCGYCGAIIGHVTGLQFPVLPSMCTGGQCAVCRQTGLVSPAAGWIGDRPVDTFEQWQAARAR